VTRWLPALALVAAIAAAAPAAPQSAAVPVRYHFSFPDPARHAMQVEATFSGIGDQPLDLRISRSSPGRYSLHDFAKNVYDVHVYAPDQRELRTERPDDSGWRVPVHPDSVTVKYKVAGTRVDGTYLAIDPTHAHINMPAAIMWARGLDDRPATLQFEPPAGAKWQIATQLFPGRTATEFTAPNLQYLVDSPVEYGPLTIETFTVESQPFRFAAHHTGTAAELQSLVGDVAKIVRQEKAVYGEFPPYETGVYTFIADYLPSAAPDAMEHRNSTVMTSPSSIATARIDLLDTAAHEFFHGWNVERIRPRSLEPFDLERANPSGELWLAEGFTQYYGPLALHRAGLVTVEETADTIARVLNLTAVRPGRRPQSAEAVSRLAPLTDGVSGPSRPNVVSYYYLGSAIALALDLSLRDRSAGAASLDDFMRTLWTRFGKPGGARPGYVDHPYTVDDLEAVLAEVAGDRAFAHDFFARYIRGQETPNHARLLSLAGFIVTDAAGPVVTVAPVESAGGLLTPAQRSFRDRWLGPR
jgi:predicted metalloprotease with PDZ domain